MPCNQPTSPPIRSFLNSPPQTSAVAKDGIMEGSVAITPMVRRNGILVITTAHARNPPRPSLRGLSKAPPNRLHPHHVLHSITRVSVWPLLVFRSVWAFGIAPAEALPDTIHRKQKRALYAKSEHYAYYLEVFCLNPSPTISSPYHGCCSQAENAGRIPSKQVKEGRRHRQRTRDPHSEASSPRPGLARSACDQRGPHDAGARPRRHGHGPR